MESNSETSPQNENTTAAEQAICKSCKRAISQATGKCYYCAEADPKDIKKLNFIMLDWQRKAASDPDLRSTEKNKKVLSLIQIFMASACFALGIVPDFIPFEGKGFYFIFGATAAVSCYCFHFNSLTLIYCLITNIAVMIFFLQMAFECIPNLIIPAFVCGFVASLSAFTLFLIMVRIFKNKAVEI